MVEDKSVKVRILINNINSGDVGYNFEKQKAMGNV